MLRLAIETVQSGVLYDPALTQASDRSLQILLANQAIHQHLRVVNIRKANAFWRIPVVGQGAIRRLVLRDGQLLALALSSEW